MQAPDGVTFCFGVPTTYRSSTDVIWNDRNIANCIKFHKKVNKGVNIVVEKLPFFSHDI